jgi:hypothetical protein
MALEPPLADLVDFLSHEATATTDISPGACIPVVIGSLLWSMIDVTTRET